MIELIVVLVIMGSCISFIVFGVRRANWAKAHLIPTVNGQCAPLPGRSFLCTQSRSEDGKGLHLPTNTDFWVRSVDDSTGIPIYTLTDIANKPTTISQSQLIEEWGVQNIKIVTRAVEKKDESQDFKDLDAKFWYVK